MHDVFVTLNSLEVSAYVISGMALILLSLVVRRVAIEPNEVADTDRRDGVAVRVRSKKVVPINRNAHAWQRPVFPVRRVGNYS